MAEKFLPPETIQVLCRFCKKVMTAQLDRSIAGAGKTVDRGGTFEFYCQKCFHSFCYHGTDLPERPAENEELQIENVEYTPKSTYVIGQIVTHKKFKDKGPVVDKERGTPARVLISFKKKGLTKLVEGL